MSTQNLSAQNCPPYFFLPQISPFKFSASILTLHNTTPREVFYIILNTHFLSRLDSIWLKLTWLISKLSPKSTTTISRFVLNAIFSSLQIMNPMISNRYAAAPICLEWLILGSSQQSWSYQANAPNLVLRLVSLAI